MWNPKFKKNVTRIENVQRHFTKCVVGHGDLGYEDRLKSLNLPSLEFRRLRGDLIEAFKILQHIYDVKTTQTLFSLTDVTLTRGHNLKLTKNFVRTSGYQHFFTNRVVNLWNSLPQETVSVGTVNAFQNGLDRYFKDKMFCTNLK